ncbi:unnamed protein product [Phyllotreta striolata]|uniref:Uncharacterized protein n=1 Tax=Phyllotreta striolata TaxID=444603 RepID=A0A9N9TFK1_PHYSR|nr:unnamed protein product [Phyllotreta striolata]
MFLKTLIFPLTNPDMKILLLLLNVPLFCYVVGGSDCRKEPQCSITRVHKMKSGNCYDRKFRSFPKCLATDVEVIDLTFNRIRKVSKTDMSKFSYLKFLYLADNLITNLEEDVFEDLSGLTTLDLSLNALQKVPVSVFKLPALTSLYLGQNLNINIADALDMARPLKSPLTKIDISRTTDEENYSVFPDFGILPYLVVLNITENYYYTLTPSLFMGFCNLKTLDSANVTTEFEDPCDCWRLNTWLKNRKVKFTLFKCTVIESRCLDNDLTNEDLLIHEKCSEMYKSNELKHTINTILIGVGSTLAVMVFILLIVFYRRRRRIKRNGQLRKNQTERTQNDALKHLNNQQICIPNEYS